MLLFIISILYFRPKNDAALSVPSFGFIRTYVHKKNSNLVYYVVCTEETTRLLQLLLCSFGYFRLFFSSSLNHSLEDDDGDGDADDDDETTFPI